MDSTRRIKAGSLPKAIQPILGKQPVLGGREGGLKHAN